MAATVRVKTKHSPLAFLLYMTKVTISVDGDDRQVRWGEEVLSLEPGSHEIGISFRYLGRDTGKATVSLDLADSSTTTVAYKAPFLATSAGKVTVESS